MDEVRGGARRDDRGLFHRLVSIDRLEEIRDEVEGHHHEGMFEEAFYRELQGKFSFQRPAGLDAQSIVVVSRPQPAVSVTMRWNGEDRPLLIPPGYTDAVDLDVQAVAALSDLLLPGPYRFVKALLPLKLLAARSGLVRYGRNNNTYLPRFGSFHRLTAFFSDAPCEEDQWQEQEQLPGCEGCGACLRACPTGALTEERFMMRSEICLTYLNEKDTSQPFPAWVDRRAHHALVGCMQCQKVCPYDKNVVYWSSDRGSFTEGETAMLLDGRAAELEEKLKGLGLTPAIFPRNLAALLGWEE